ncbi:hypothetical protein [Caballeronia mineralivorans]|uniref:hypothetical protein n=1 Tax=Caballeronia mineralivorans TaxID=2010198 RepID=UPI0023F1FB9A|nr:hypothetical protein [Caballeronia mineralivorans]MDB5784799.1 hypothetical protein [Caballeronia mineralivorans]
MRAYAWSSQTARDRSGLPGVMLARLLSQEERYLVAGARRRIRKAAEDPVLPEEPRVDAVLQGGVRRGPGPT